MNLSHIFNIFNMSGYGLYVWPAYAITLFVFGFNFFLFVREKKQVKKILQQSARKLRQSI